MKKNLPLILLCYAAIYLIWGSTYLFIAYAVETIPVLWILVIRFLFSGLVFITVPLALGQVKRMPAKQEIFSACFLGFFLLILGTGVVTYAEKTVDSYVAALIIATVPLIVAFFNRIFFKQPLSWIKILGMVIGFSGVALLLYNGADVFSGLRLGNFLILFAIFAWGFGTSYSKKLKFHPNVLFSTGIEMLAAGIIAGLAAVLTTDDISTVFADASPLSWFSLAYLSLIGGTALAAYSYLLKHEPTQRVTSYSLVNPVIATVLGIVIRKETPQPLLFFGMPLILAGLFLMLYVRKKNNRQPPGRG